MKFYWLSQTKADDVLIIAWSIVCNVIILCRYEAGRAAAALVVFLLGAVVLYLVVMPLPVIVSAETAAVLIAASMVPRVCRHRRAKLLREFGAHARYCQRCGDIQSARVEMDRCRECGNRRHIPIARIILGHTDMAAMYRTVARRHGLVLVGTVCQAALLCAVVFYLKDRVTLRDADFVSRWTIFGIVVLAFGVSIFGLYGVAPNTKTKRVLSGFADSVRQE